MELDLWLQKAAEDRADILLTKMVRDLWKDMLLMLKIWLEEML